MKRGIMVGGVALAMVAALAYFLTAAGIIQPGDLGIEEAPPTIAYAAGIGYVVGGLLILVRKRWLWITGAVINALVIAMFFSAYMSRPNVLLSIPGLGTKIPEVLLEISLIYLIMTYRQRRV